MIFFFLMILVREQTVRERNLFKRISLLIHIFLTTWSFLSKFVFFGGGGGYTLTYEKIRKQTI